MVDSQSNENLERLFRFSLAKVREWERAIGEDGVNHIQTSVLKQLNVSARDFYTSEQLRDCTRSQLDALDQIIKEYVEFKVMLSAIGMTLKLSEEGVGEVSRFLNATMPGFERKLKGYVGFIVQEMASAISRGGAV